MTCDLVHTWLCVTFTWPSFGVDRAAAILTPDDGHHVEPMAGANVGSCGQESMTLFGTCGVVPDGSFYRFRSRPSGDQLSGLLDERRRLLKADGHNLVWILYLLDTEGRGRSFPVTVNRVGRRSRCCGDVG